MEPGLNPRHMRREEGGHRTVLIISVNSISEGPGCLATAECVRVRLKPTGEVCVAFSVLAQQPTETQETQKLSCTQKHFVVWHIYSWH